MSTQSDCNEKALAAFVCKKEEIDVLLERIAGASRGHFDVLPENVNYGHAGNLTEAVKHLREAARWLGAEKPQQE